MPDKVVEMKPKAERLAEGEAVSPMMWSMEFAGMGKSTAAHIEAVVQTNLQAMQELLRAENPKAMLKLQQRFAPATTWGVLMRGTMALVDAIESGSNVREHCPVADHLKQAPYRKPYKNGRNDGATGIRS